MKAYTITVHATISEDEGRKEEFSFGSEEDRDWFLDKICEWSANEKYEEDIYEYFTVSPSEAVEWPYDLPPREYQLEECKRYLQVTNH